MEVWGHGNFRWFCKIFAGVCGVCVILCKIVYVHMCALACEGEGCPLVSLWCSPLDFLRNRSLLKSWASWSTGLPSLGGSLLHLLGLQTGTTPTELLCASGNHSPILRPEKWALYLLSHLCKPWFYEVLKLYQNAIIAIQETCFSRK